MPVEIKELVIKAIIAIDWDKQIIAMAKEDEVCLRLPANKEIASYVKKYFKKNNAKRMSFDKSALSAFLTQWKDSLKN